MRHQAFRWTCGSLCALAMLAPGCHHGDGGSSFSPAPIVGSGTIVSESRTLPPFQGIIVRIAETQIVVTRTGTQSFLIETDDNIIDEIRTTVSGGVLFIESDANYDTDYDVRISIDMTAVQSLEMRGVGSITASGLGPGGDLSVVVGVPGVGNITLSGAVDTYDARLEGVGNIDAEALQTHVSTINLSGVGNCRITVTETLNATISGNGNICYAGSPTDVNPSIIPPGIGQIEPIGSGPCI